MTTSQKKEVLLFCTSVTLLPVSALTEVVFCPLFACLPTCMCACQPVCVCGMHVYRHSCLPVCLAAHPVVCKQSVSVSVVFVGVILEAEATVCLLVTEKLIDCFSFCDLWCSKAFF